jgi:hypothetical protein
MRANRVQHVKDEGVKDEGPPWRKPPSDSLWKGVDFDAWAKETTQCK